MDLIIITGLPASGNSTLAAAAHNAFGWPILEKDLLKEKLFETVGFKNHAEKDALDVRANAELLSLLEDHLSRGESVIIDNNFDTETAADLGKLLARFSPRTAVVQLTGDPAVFFARYFVRDFHAKRHIGHALQDHYPLREGEEFSFSMSFDEYRRIFIDRGMANADWAPDRLSFDVSKGDLPVAEILDAILQLFPLDSYVEHPVSLMEVMPGDNVETPIWDTYKEIVAKYDERGASAVGTIERFAFYEETKKVYAVIATGESALYANIMLQKGVVKD